MSLFYLAVWRLSSRKTVLILLKFSFIRYVNISRLLQDIPFFIIRCVVLVLYGLEDQLIFLVKNAVWIGLVSLEIKGFPDDYQNNGPPPGRQPNGQTNRGYNNNP